MRSAPDHQTLLDLTGVGRWAWFVNAARIEVSPAWEALYGYAAGSFSGRYEDWLRHLATDDQRALEDITARLLDGRSSSETLEYRIRTLQGDWRWVHSRVGVVHGDDSPIEQIVGLAMDVSSLHRARHESDLLRRRLDRLFEASPIGIAFLDLEGRFLDANPAFCELTGWPVDALRQRSYRDLTPTDELAAADREFSQLRVDHTAAYRLRQGCHTADGGVVPIEVFGNAVIDADGRPEVLIAQVVDRSLDAAAIARLEEMADRDWVTGLHNARYLKRSLQAQLQGDIPASRAALIQVDLSGFRQVITLAGHPAGDRVLREVAYLLLRPLADGDELIRLGGDRFIALCHFDDPEVPMQRATQMVAEVAAHRFMVEGIEMRLLATAGVRLITQRDQDPDTVIADVDATAREAKSRERGGVRLFTPADRAIIHEARQAFQLKRLNEAVRHGQLVQVLEPLVHARRGGVAGYEVLTRIHARDGDLQSIGPYMAAAERAYAIAEIDLGIVAETLPRLARHCRGASTPPMFTINLSAYSLQGDRFIERLRQLLTAHRMPRGSLCFEITETAAVNHLDNLQRAAQMIRAEGAQLIVDDFGSGFSSLGALMALRPGGLKIDRALVQQVVPDPIQRRVVRSLVQLAHSLGAFVVLEGVETVEHLRVAQELEADYLQGYAFGKALPLDTLLS